MIQEWLQFFVCISSWWISCWLITLIVTGKRSDIPYLWEFNESFPFRMTRNTSEWPAFSGVLKGLVGCFHRTGETAPLNRWLGGVESGVPNAARNPQEVRQKSVRKSWRSCHGAELSKARDAHGLKMALALGITGRQQLLSAMCGARRELRELVDPGRPMVPVCGFIPTSHGFLDPL
jgi:hypothetical protein